MPSGWLVPAAHLVCLNGDGEIAVPAEPAVPAVLGVQAAGCAAPQEGLLLRLLVATSPPAALHSRLQLTPMSHDLTGCSEKVYYVQAEKAQLGVVTHLCVRLAASCT